MLKFAVSAVLILGFTVYKGYALECWACSSDIDRSCADQFNSSDILRFGGGYYQAGYQTGSQQYDPYSQRPYDRDSNNRDYRNRDYNSRDPSNRDPNYDRDRNRDQYNRDSNNRDYARDGSRDPYFDRDNRDPYNRDPNNRDYPLRDSNRDYNQQGRSYDTNYPPRDYRAQASQSGPRLVTCNEEEARLRRMRNVCIKKVQRIGEHQLTYIRRCEMISFDKDIGTCYDAVARGISLDYCEYCERDGCNSATGLKFNVLLASLVPMVLIWAFLS